jgi:hypothetical protein
MLPRAVDTTSTFGAYGNGVSPWDGCGTCGFSRLDRHGTRPRHLQLPVLGESIRQPVVVAGWPIPSTFVITTIVVILLTAINHPGYLS